jgi:ubiquinone/menaquinone biosynthesis C-methylase UbiE
MGNVADNPFADNPFEQLAPDYESWYGTPLGSYVVDREGEALLQALADMPAGRLVDIGAGTGWWSRVLAWRGWLVTAVEPSPAMAALGMERCRHLSVAWVQADAAELPLADQTQDAALFYTVLEFLAAPQTALREAWRVVRPGGAIVVAHLDPGSSWAALYRMQAERGISPWTTARFISDDAIAEWLGAPPSGRWPCVWLGPAAEPPFEEADRCGRRAGHPPALTVMRWRKSK